MIGIRVDCEIGNGDFIWRSLDEGWDTEVLGFDRRVANGKLVVTTIVLRR
jgi:hypothetical protein